jgi:regulatory protein
MDDTDPVKVRSLILEMLARREYSAWELKRKLGARKYQATLIETVLIDLSRDGLQSDQRFTENYIRSRAERGFGPRRIAAELRERGVSKTLIVDCLKQEEGQWDSQALESRHKRFGQAPPDSLKERDRQVRFLQYRGFTREQINHALSEIDD